MKSISLEQLGRELVKIVFVLSRSMQASSAIYVFRHSIYVDHLFQLRREYIHIARPSCCLKRCSSRSFCGRSVNRSICPQMSPRREPVATLSRHLKRGAIITE